MSYTRAGRKLLNIPGQPLIVEDLNYEGHLIKTFAKTGTVPNGYFQIRNGKKVQITKEEYIKLKEEREK